MDFRKFLIIFVLTIGNTSSLNEEKDQTLYTQMESPFRSQKVNMLWNKARYVIRFHVGTYLEANHSSLFFPTDSHP